MIKQIPRHLFSEEMSSNVTHFNLNNLLENYEHIFDIKNFKVSNIYKSMFEQMLSKYKEGFKCILSEDTSSSASEKESISKDFSLYIKDCSFEDLYSNTSSLFTLGEVNNETKTYSKCTHLLSSFANSQPLISSSSFQNQVYSNVHDSNGIGICTNSSHEVLESSDQTFKDYIAFLKNAFPNMNKLDFYIIKWFYKVVSLTTFEETPSLLSACSFQSKNDNYERYQSVIADINGCITTFLSEETLYTENTESIYFPSFKIWFQQEISSENPFDLFSDENKFNPEHSTIKLFVDNHLNIHTRPERWTVIKKIIFSFRKHFTAAISNFMFSLLELMKHFQLENKNDKIVQKQMFANNLIFVKKKTKNTTKLNHMSCNLIFNSVEQKSILNDNIQNNIQTYELTKFVELRKDNNNQKLFSRYNKDIVDLFLKNSLDFSNELKLISSSEELEVNSVLLDSQEIISFNTNTSHFTTNASFTQNQLDFIWEYINNNLKKKIKVLYVPGLDNRSKKKNIFVQNISLKTITKKSGFLIPILLPFEGLNEKGQTENYSCFTFLNLNNDLLDSSFVTFCNYYTNSFYKNFSFLKLMNSRMLDSEISAISSVNKLLQQFFSYHCSLLFDKETFLEKKNNFFAGINKYNEDNLEFVLQSKYVNTMNLAKTSTKLGEDLSDPSFVQVLAQVQVDKNIEREYQDIDKKYKNLLNQKDTCEEELNEYQKLIDHYIKKIESDKYEIEKLKITQNKLSSKISTYSSTASLVKTKYDDVLSRYKDDYKKNKNLKNFSINSYSLNLLKNNVNVSFILFKNNKLKDDYLFYFNEEDSSSLKDYDETLWNKYYRKQKYVDEIDIAYRTSQAFSFTKKIDEVFTILNNGDWTIHCLSFTTIEPSLIKVDNSENYVTGGPYRIIVDQDSLYIGLLNISSLFGSIKHRKKLQSIKAHPHSSPINYTSNKSLLDYLSPASACLGEASALIYKAFNEKDLSTSLSNIIISVMIWVKSANSVDYWGKSYKHFPKPETIKFNFEKLKNLPSITEIDSFIDNVLEEPAEEVTENQEEVTEILNPPTVETPTSIESFNTQSTYVRYT